MIFGIEALETVKDLSRKLVTILKQIVDRIEVLENKKEVIIPTTPSETSSIGDIRESILTEVQFQTLNTTKWVLMDGRSILGTDLATLTGISNIPDARGAVLRAKNNGRSDGKQNPDGDLALGTYQADAIRNISGQFAFTDDGSTSMRVRVAEATGPFSFNIFSASQVNSSGVPGASTQPNGVIFDASTQVPTALDNRMKNITVNIFIKINN